MVDRLQKFRALATHAWYGKKVASLRIRELLVLEEFIEKNAGLEPTAFYKAVCLFEANELRSTMQKAPYRASLMVELLHVVK